MSNTWKDSSDLSTKMDRDRAKAERKRVKADRKVKRSMRADSDDDSVEAREIYIMGDPQWSD